MGKTLYLECYSGISGDMTVGALLDLGADREVLETALESLGVDGYQLHFGRKMKCGIDAYDFDVHLLKEEHEGSHEHEHGHEHEHAHAHIHRNIADIRAIIDRLQANDHVKELANRMFHIVAEAESKAHGIPVEEVHFHEVGAIDSIVDIISVAVCLDNLAIDQIILSPLAEGRGYVRCQHGVMPVPVPATANIAAAHGLELKLTDNEGEMVTPTGAAIAAALNQGKRLPKHYRIKKIGIGAGNKDFKNANILRAMLIQPIEENGFQMWTLETNIDDCSGEALGFAMECLLDAGAADAWYTPIFMKKNRPAYMLQVLCREELTEKMEDIILAQTTSIGVRKYPVERTIMDRRQELVQTPYGEARVKVCTHKGTTFCYPEYESIAAICRNSGEDFGRIYHMVMELAMKEALELNFEKEA